MKPKALILLAPGTNRHLDVARAFELAGAAPHVVPLSRLRAQEERLANYQILVIPGGFSYADCLGSGRRLALELQSFLREEVHEFVQGGKPVLGICNGFQTLVQAGLLPQSVHSTLAHNEQGDFVCRWVSLQPQSSRCVWTRGLQEPIHCPVAHGEGNFQVESPAVLAALGDQIALRYAPLAGTSNPSGSMGDIAGVCNPQGNVLGLMPHPENHIHSYQYPFGPGEAFSGRRLFEQGVAYANQL
jgi:phosphoribosylformylglycinamidine synthase subunit PurQ / glutaminase